MLGFIFGHRDAHGEAARRMAAEQMRVYRSQAGNSFANCTWNGQRFNGNPIIDLVEIDGVWQMPPEK
jgi:hypothetical protein